MINKPKKLISVICEYRKTGEIIPLYIVWDDAIKYPIERVLNVQPAAIVGIEGIRYTVKIGSQQRIMYLSEGKWYIETQ